MWLERPVELQQRQLAWQDQDLARPLPACHEPHLPLHQPQAHPPSPMPDHRQV